MQYFSNKALNTVTKGTYTISKAVLSTIVPQSVPTVDDYSHEARLRFDKYVKNMYVYENDQYYFGCHTEKISAAKFNNVLNIGGYSSSSYNLPDKDLGSQTLPNYSNSNAEQKAYYGYVSNGYTEYVDGYYFGGCYFEVT